MCRRAQLALPATGFAMPALALVGLLGGRTPAPPAALHIALRLFRDYKQQQVTLGRVRLCVAVFEMSLITPIAVVLQLRPIDRGRSGRVSLSLITGARIPSCGREAYSAASFSLELLGFLYFPARLFAYQGLVSFWLPTVTYGIRLTSWPTPLGSRSAGPPRSHSPRRRLHHA
jgi:hypothetical protein